MNIEQIKELKQKAHDVVNGSARLYLDFRENFREASSKINLNPNYTDTGKLDLLGKLKGRKKAELMHNARIQKELYISYLTEAHNHADKLAYQNVPKVDEVKKERFLKSWAELKTELLFTTDPKITKQKLDEFISKIDTSSYELFEIIKDDFAKLSESVLDKTNGSERPEYVKSLRDIYDKVRHNAMPEESREAYTELEHINAMLENPRIFPSIVLDAIQSDLGVEAQSFVNTPEAYFEKYPDAEELKPEGLKTMEESIAESNAEIPRAPITIESKVAVGRSISSRTIGFKN